MSDETVPTWQALAQRKQAQREALIPSDWRLPADMLQRLKGSSSGMTNDRRDDVRQVAASCGILSSRELALTSGRLDATALTAAIRSRQYTAEEVVTAFCKRAAVAQQCCNCLTEIRFREAIREARQLDAQAIRGETMGPLHGLPISVKDTFDVAGLESTIGIAALAGKAAAEDAPLVQILRSQGAVIYCKTNVPQTLMALDSHNNLFGRTLNPRNRALTAGGSSGGEGALGAFHGSPLGVGTDVGGSIRIPAMCNGLYGIKPSAGRVPFAGQQGGDRPGASRLGLQACAGPLATSLRDCGLFLQSVAAAQPWDRDPAVVFGPWAAQGELSQRPLIGVLMSDGVVPPLPPVRRVLEETAAALRAHGGVDVVLIEAPSFRQCNALTNAFFSIDGGNTVLDLLERTGEPLHPWLAGRVTRRPPRTMAAVAELQAARTALETALLTELWRDPSGGGRRVDALVCPVAPHPVPPIDRWNSVGYTSALVLLDLPAGVVPVRDVSEEDLGVEMEGPVLGKWDEVNRGLWSRNTIDRSVYLNSPLSIQVVAPRLQERRLYQAMCLIDEALKKANGHEGETLRGRL